MNKLYEANYSGVLISVEQSCRGKYHAFFIIDGALYKTSNHGEERVIWKAHNRINKILNPKKKVNPDYIKLAQIAYDVVLQTMLEGEASHPWNPTGDWKRHSADLHWFHAKNHLIKHGENDKSEDHISHALTRCAMIKYLEQTP